MRSISPPALATIAEEGARGGGETGGVDLTTVVVDWGPTSWAEKISVGEG